MKRLYLNEPDLFELIECLGISFTALSKLKQEESANKVVKLILTIISKMLESDTD